MTWKERITRLLQELSRGVYEKETELSLSLLAALAGENVLLLGPPGVAKSMIARRLKCAFAHARSFEYLMSRFSTPDEIFGPVSISLLKEKDVYQRNVRGYLPDAEVAFLDEIWKAGPAIQNALLTVMNEKLFRNGEKEIRIPLKLLIGASNELPTEGEGLEALWDRFLVRLVSGCITDEQLFRRMLLDDQTGEAEVSQPITAEEYDQIQEGLNAVGCAQEVLDCITRIRRALDHIPVPDSNLDHRVYVSDRRWKKILRLLKTSAYIQGRRQVERADLFPVWQCLWNEPEEREGIRKSVLQSLFAPCIDQLEKLRQEVTETQKLTSVKACLAQAERLQDHRNDGLVLYHKFYYHLLNHGVGNTFVFLVDFHRLKDYKRTDPPTPGILYKDPQNPKRTLVRIDNGQSTQGIEVLDHVNLYRINKNLYINGVAYAIEEHRFNEVSTPLTADAVELPPFRDYEKEVETLVSALAAYTFSLKDNMFLSAADKKEMDELSAALRKRIALLRVDIEKIRFNENA